jgi:hypothetical protein
MVDLQKIADGVLKPKLEKAGLDRIVIREGIDHDGEEALFIDAQMKPNVPIVGGDISLKLYGALSQALLHAGERRFPYFNIRHPDKERLPASRKRPSRRAS